MARSVGFREAATERRDTRPSWTVRVTGAPCIDRIWARRYTSADVGTGVPAENLAVMSTLYRGCIVADMVPCDDPAFVMFELLPPVESLNVHPDDMSGVVSALSRSGYHASCTDHHGKTYEF